MFFHKNKDLEEFKKNFAYFSSQAPNAEFVINSPTFLTSFLHTTDHNEGLAKLKKIQEDKKLNRKDEYLIADMVRLVENLIEINSKDIELSEEEYKDKKKDIISFYTEVDCLVG